MSRFNCLPLHHLTLEKIMKKIFLFLLLITSACTALAEEISLFNSRGEPVAYIDTDDEDCTIYMWNGYPVAYLTTTSDDDFSIYGFNGKHLGWYADGIVRDHQGYAVGFAKGAISKYTQYESYKSYKQYKPYKSYKQYAPYKPYYKSTFSNESLSLFLKRGR